METAKRGIHVAPFDELADPALLADLASRAEQRGWDGFFLWDHVLYREPVRAILDPWVALSAIAVATERVRIGALVTPPARRRAHKLARETATLDLLSGGRLVFGAGLGGDGYGEFSRFGDPEDPRERAVALDAGLEALVGYWESFEPRPVQRPRIPVWLASRWPKRKPVRRAAQWDGLFPIDLPGPEALEELAAEVAELREGKDAPFDVVVANGAEVDPGPWAAAGATWCLTDFGLSPRRSEVMAAIDAGP
jgi:alkanesulfonate monooxygenase SsuD/methylene tetrahydromethanopterin reductase-like flavin-dependent oxidoreductase (luciferase family)